MSKSNVQLVRSIYDGCAGKAVRLDVNWDRDDALRAPGLEA